MNTGFATTTIYGTLRTPVEQKYYGVQNPRPFLEMVLTVEGGEKKAAQMFTVSVFDEGLQLQAQQLRLNQRVLVVCQLDNKPWQGRDGRLRDSLSLKARAIVPGEAHAAERATRPAPAAPPAPSYGRGMMGQRSGQVQQNTEEEEDIPF